MHDDKYWNKTFNFSSGDIDEYIIIKYYTSTNSDWFDSNDPGEEGSDIDMIYLYVPAFWDAFFFLWNSV